nr:T9SS type A sorting domain-containing protein [Ginsengibacter hankyongi]
MFATEKIAVTITDASGRTIQTSILKVNAGKSIVRLNLDKLPSGAYYLNAKFNKGKETILFMKKQETVRLPISVM